MGFIQEACSFLSLHHYWLTNFICRWFFPLLTLTTISVSPFLLPSPQLWMPCYLPKCSALVVRGILPLVVSLNTSAELKICDVTMLLRRPKATCSQQPFLVWDHHQHYPWHGYLRLQVKAPWATNTMNQHKVSLLWHMTPMLPPYKKFLVDELDHNGTPVKSPDPANIADADAFEELAPHGHFFPMTTLDQPAIDESPDMPDVLEQLPNGIGAGNTEGMPTVVINHFPSASAGAPINDMRRGNSMYES